MMDVFAAVKTMLAVRSYQKKTISDEAVKRIVEAGRLTGSAKNRQKWDFVVVRSSDSLLHLGELASSGPFVAQAAMAIAVLVSDTFFAYLDGTRATQDMMLVAWELGIGSNWIAHVDTKPIREMLKVPPNRVILNIIAFGYPAQQLGKGRKKRKPLQTIVHQEAYGRPLFPTDSN